MSEIAFIIIGFFAGGIAGLLGLGGGLIVVPLLVFFMHFTQKEAQGTTIAMLLPPIGLGAAYVYWRAGHVNIKAAALLALGFMVGGLLGSGVGANFSDVTLSKLFGALLGLFAIKLLLF